MGKQGAGEGDTLGMEIRPLVENYLQSARLMQLATVRDGQPWVCTVYFVADEDMNLYWLSWPERRHSREVAQHDKAAAAVVVQDGGDRKPVVGIQVEGTVAEVTDEEAVKRISETYAQKYGQGKRFYKNFKTGTNRHHMYKLMPQKLVLFDEQNFSAENARQELSL